MNRLGGWWRIWIVGTALLLAFGTVIGLQQRELDIELSGKDVCLPGTIETNFESQPSLDGWSALQKTPPEVLARGEVLNPRVNVEQFSCVSWSSMLNSWAVALAAAMTMLLTVYVARWVLAGFKRSQN